MKEEINSLIQNIINTKPNKFLFGYRIKAHCPFCNSKHENGDVSLSEIEHLDDCIYIQATKLSSINAQNMIPITEELPPFNTRVLFRAINGFKTYSEDLYFDDILTNKIEHLDYGRNAYLLENNSDYLVSQDRDFAEYSFQCVTHWCMLPYKNEVKHD